MAKLQTILFLGLGLVFLTAANANSLDNSNEIVKVLENEDVFNISRMIDDNFYYVQNFLNTTFEPFPLEDMHVPAIGILTDGQLHKLSLIKRADKCVVKYANQKICANLNLGWSDVDFNYNYSFKIFNSSLNGLMNGQVVNMKINVVMCADLQNLILKLDKFHVTKIGKINLQMSGSGGSRIIGLIGKLLANMSKIIIKKVVDVKVVKILQDNIDLINEIISQYKPQSNSTNVMENIIVRHYYNNLLWNGN